MTEAPPPSVVLAGVAGRCPRCGRGRLFARTGLGLTIAPRCEACKLDFAFVDPGDGPAVFAIMILGFVMLGAALVIEFRYAPPLWVHVAVLGPITLLAAIALLRPLKGVLVALQFRHKAGLGQLADRRPPESGA